jgi:hypothetical protein
MLKKNQIEKGENQWVANPNLLMIYIEMKLESKNENKKNKKISLKTKEFRKLEV